MKNLTDKNIFNWMAYLSAVGIVLATYLLYNFYAVVPSTICDISPSLNCGAVTKGTLATFAGIPVALVGLIGYAVILFSALTKKKKLALAMTTFGLVFCLRLTILEIFFLKVLCPVCIACQLVMLFVFLGSVYLVFKKK